jgi:mitogen-activated protein kinase 1/3
VDIWSVGCIFAELYLRKPLFPGKTTIDQLRMVCAAFGKPPTAGVDDPAAIKMLASIPDTAPVPLERLVPKMTNPQALDFLSHMLEKDPRRRWSAAQLLQHPFLAGVHDPADEPAPPKGAYSWEYERTHHRMDLDQLRWAFWKEMCAFHPRLAQIAQPRAAPTAAAVSHHHQPGTTTTIVRQVAAPVTQHVVQHQVGAGGTTHVVRTSPIPQGYSHVTYIQK